MGTILRKRSWPLCIIIRRVTPADVRGIFDLFEEKKKFDFEVELPPSALSLATFSLFKCGLHGSRKLPCGAIFFCFHMRVYHPVSAVSFFF